MSNEVKIGILAIVTIVLSIWGYKFIQGKNILQKSNSYTVYYGYVDRLQVGTVVFINGVNVGSVADVSLMDDPNRTVKVVIDLTPGMRIPKNTVAVISSTGFMGGKAIMLEYDQPCSGKDCAESGDTLEGEYRGLLGSMVSEESVGAYLEVLKDGLKDLADTLNYELLSEESDTPLSRSMHNLEQTLSNLNATSGQLNSLLRNSSGDIEGSLENVEAITGNLKANNARITSILSNADSLSQQLAAADLEQTLVEVNDAIASLKKTMNTADQALVGVSGVVDQINQGEGTLGRLIQSDALYNRITKLSNNTDSLINDFQERPYRYMPLKSRRRVNKYDRQDASDGN